MGGALRAKTIDAAVRVLAAGGLVALPTETVYGLAADATNATAVARIFRVKGRPAEHPLILHLSRFDDLGLYAAGDPPALRRLAQCFWPGPLTIIVQKSDLVAAGVTGGQSTVALRVPDHPLTQAILDRLGRAVAAPSANRFGRISPTTAEHVADDLGADVDLIVDGGPARIGVESTIIDVTGDVPAILRAGAIGPTALGDALGQPVVTRIGGAVRAPGMLRAHYAPRASLRLVEQAELERESVAQAQGGKTVGILNLPADSAAAARGLYAALRALDAAGYDVVLAVLPPATEEYAAIRDRLIRAATP